MNIEERVKYYLGKYYHTKIYHEILPSKYIENGNKFAYSENMLINKNNLYNIFKKYTHDDIEYHYLYPLIEILNEINFDNKSFLYCWGDISHSIGRDAVITKTRPRGNKTMILQKLVNFRHWNEKNFKDVISYDIAFNRKINKAIWRGASTGFVQNIGSRFDLIKKYFNNEIIDVGFSKIVQDKDEYKYYLKNIIPIKEQLKYKFIISVEGNDVASGLKWQLYSNSIVLMYQPTIESWLMEFKLKPYVHYVPIKNDFSDILKQIDWCNNNYDKCIEIIKNSTKYIKQFLNLRKEKIIRKKIFQKYFENIIFFKKNPQNIFKLKKLTENSNIKKRNNKVIDQKSKILNIKKKKIIKNINSFDVIKHKHIKNKELKSELIKKKLEKYNFINSKKLNKTNQKKIDKDKDKNQEIINKIINDINSINYDINKNNNYLKNDNKNCVDDDSYLNNFDPKFDYELIDSCEFNNINFFYNDKSSNFIIDELYKIYLKRKPDKDGLKFYKFKLNDKGYKYVVKKLKFSNEAKKNNIDPNTYNLKNRELLIDLYNYYFHRFPDNEGLNFYIFKLYEKGIEYILNKLKNCEEHQKLIKNL